MFLFLFIEGLLVALGEFVTKKQCHSKSDRCVNCLVKFKLRLGVSEK